MKTVPIPIAMLAVGQPLPVDVWSGGGQLLLKKGQPIVSEQHKEKLHSFNACTTAADGLAWQRAYERMVHALMREGVALQEIANATMPTEIRESDYVVGQEAKGGWVDLQSILRGILYQGGLAIHPASRLEALKRNALRLLEDNPDDSLFCLYQALGDDSLGYCATHALLCFAMCELTGIKLGWPLAEREPLHEAALTMNIAMAREQDSMARQNSVLTDWQRSLIADHGALGAGLLSQLGWSDADLLDIVRWHHTPEAPDALPRNLARRKLLAYADGFAARTAARKTRSAQSAVKAVKSMVLGAQGESVALSSAMAQAVGFYPPGTYVLLANGETAVSVQRGQRANMPWVISLLDKDNMPLGPYVCKESTTPALTIQSPVAFADVRVTVNLDKVRKARQRIPRATTAPA